MTWLASSRPSGASVTRPSRTRTRWAISSSESKASTGTPRRVRSESESRSNALVDPSSTSSPPSGRCALHHGDVALGRAHVPKAPTVLVRVGGRTEASVVTLIPVDVIMATLVTGLGPVGNLFPLVTVLVEHPAHQVVGVGGVVLVGMAGGIFSQRRARLRGERVTAEVRRRIFQTEQVVGRVLQARKGLG